MHQSLFIKEMSSTEKACCNSLTVIPDKNDDKLFNIRLPRVKNDLVKAWNRDL